MLRVIRVKLITGAFPLSCNKNAVHGFGFFDHGISFMTLCFFLVIFALT